MILILGFLASGLLVAADLEKARALYQRTSYTQALAVLQPENSKDPEVLLLAGKSAFMLGDLKKADLYLRAATQLTPKSEYFHWYGKVLGRRAERANFLVAPKLAVDCRKAFEKAVALGPANIEALNDLFEYHLEAPGFLGGGIDKAAETAARIGQLDRVEKHYAQARLAEKRKDFPQAEFHLRQAVELAPREPGRLIDLAKFLVRRGRSAESEAVFQRAEKVAPNHPKLLFERAQVYVTEKRRLDEARHLLTLYLKADLTPDDPPRADAERLLRTISGA
jgi:Flp pilus assembly protein TadD